MAKYFFNPYTQKVEILRNKFVDNEKLYFGTGKDVEMYYNGTNMLMTTGGNFGLNTAVPTAQFHLTAPTAATIGYKITGAGSQTADYFHAENSANAELFSVRVPSASTRGAKVVSRTTGGTVVSFEAYEPANGFPRAQFIVGDTTISNAGMTFSPSIDARTIFIDLSTYSDVTNASNKRTIIASNSAGYGAIYTGTGSAADGGALYIGTTQTQTNGSLFIDTNANGQRIGIKNTSPTAYLHLGAGTTAANTAPLRFTSGSLNTTPVAGGVEFLTDRLTFVGTTGATRKDIADFVYRGITALRTLDGSDELVDCTANSFTVTFPTAVGFTKQYVVKNSGTGVITLATTSGQTIDGNASGVLTLNQYDSITVRSNGANLIII